MAPEFNEEQIEEIAHRTAGAREKLILEFVPTAAEAIIAAGVYTHTLDNLHDMTPVQNVEELKYLIDTMDDILDAAVLPNKTLYLLDTMLEKSSLPPQVLKNRILLEVALKLKLVAFRPSP